MKEIQLLHTPKFERRGPLSAQVKGETLNLLGTSVRVLVSTQDGI